MIATLAFPEGGTNEVCIGVDAKLSIDFSSHTVSEKPTDSCVCPKTIKCVIYCRSLKF